MCGWRRCPQSAPGQEPFLCNLSLEPGACKESSASNMPSKPCHSKGALTEIVRSEIVRLLERSMLRRQPPGPGTANICNLRSQSDVRFECAAGAHVRRRALCSGVASSVFTCSRPCGWTCNITMAPAVIWKSRATNGRHCFEQMH